MTRTVERNGIQAARHAVFLAILVVGICECVGAQTWTSGAMTVTLSQNGILTVSGKGAMGNYELPWRHSSSSITGVVIEDGVTSIGERAFYHCAGLKSVTIPVSVKSIGKQAFSDCVSLKSVLIPGSVESIGEDAFSGCTGLTSVTISNGVTSIGDAAFNVCTSLKSITIPISVRSIGSAFVGCTGLTSINVNKSNPSYISVDGVLFNKAQNTLLQYPIAKQGNSYIIPNGVTTIGDGAFARCAGLTSVTIPNSVTIIKDAAFIDCIGLTSIKIPSDVTSIGNQAFCGCTSLTSIIIPSNVTFIGHLAFLECTGLTSVTSLNPIPPVIESNQAFDVSVYRMATLYVPASNIGTYGRSSNWGGRFDKIRPVEN